METLLEPDLAAGCDSEGFHARARVVALLLTEPWIQHINDAFDGERCLSDVCCHNHLRERVQSHLGTTPTKSPRKSNPGD